MSNTYLDQLVDSYKDNANFKKILFFLLLVVGCQSIAIVVLTNKVLNNLDRTRYILSPGIAALTVVRPGDLPNSYIEESFRYVTNLLNGWTYSSIRDNYKSLFNNFYTHDLVVKTQANLMSQGYFEDVSSRKMISFWRILPEESEFHWCGEVSSRTEVKGVACGIVTGEQTLFADHSIPIKKEKISYLIYAVNVAPTPKNLFAIEITRLKRGPFFTLKEELARSLKDGVLPMERLMGFWLELLKNTLGLRVP